MVGSASMRCICFGRVGASRALAPSIPARLGPLQLCDAPRAAPAPNGLAQEARERRLLPGRGELALAELFAAYPDGRPIDAEIPMTGAFGELDAGARARLIADSMRAFLGGLDSG